VPKVSRLINCPFRATGHFQKKKNHWKFTVTDPAHNHPSSLNPAAHTANQKLSDTLFEEMKRLGDAGLKPSVILEALKKNHPNEAILAKISTIYSARKKATQQALQGISPVLHLQETLKNSDFSTTPKVNDNGILTGLFFVTLAPLNCLLHTTTSFSLISHTKQTNTRCHFSTSPASQVQIKLSV
jgi:hypothetical protein